MIWRLFTEPYGDYKAGMIIAYPLGTWRAFPEGALERCSVKVEEGPRSSLRLPNWALEAIRERRAAGPQTPDPAPARPRNGRRRARP